MQGICQSWDDCGNCWEDRDGVHNLTIDSDTWQHSMSMLRLLRELFVRFETKPKSLFDRTSKIWLQFLFVGYTKMVVAILLSQTFARTSLHFTWCTSASSTRQVIDYLSIYLTFCYFHRNLSDHTQRTLRGQVIDCSKIYLIYCQLLFSLKFIRSHSKNTQRAQSEDTLSARRGHPESTCRAKMHF